MSNRSNTYEYVWAGSQPWQPMEFKTLYEYCRCSKTRILTSRDIGKGNTHLMPIRSHDICLGVSVVKAFRMAGSESEIGGHDCDFLSTPDSSLCCGICLCVARESWQHSLCGQLFCWTCLETHQKMGWDTCPHCRMEEAIFFKDNRSNKQIRSLAVRCTNKQHGCTWTGELRYLDGHIRDKCKHRKVICPKACGELVEWAKMEFHTTQECRRRNYQCPECLVIGQYDYITGDHATDCLMRLTSCPSQGCDAELCSALVLFHMHTECNFTLLECKFAPAGCTVWLPRLELQDHESDDRTHMQILLNQLEEYKTELVECTQHLEEWNIHGKELKKHSGGKKDTIPHRYTESSAEVHPTTFKIENFCCFTSTTHQFEIEVAPESYRFLLEIVLDAAGQRIRVFLSVVHGTSDDHLVWPFTGEVKIELLSQADDFSHYERTLTIPASCGRKVKPLQHKSDFRYCFHDYILYSELRKLKRFYVREDSINFRVTAKYSKHWSTSMIEPRKQYLP